MIGFIFRHRLFGCGLALAFVLLLPQQSVAAPSPGELPIAVKITSWGRTVSQWQLHPDGRHIQWEQDFSTGEQRNYSSAQLGEDIYRRAVQIVEPMQTLTNLDCPNAPTDGPSVHYELPNGTKLSFYIPCYNVKRTGDIQKFWDIEAALYGLVPWRK